MAATEESSVGEQELERLRRQYRVAEGDRKAYTDETQNTLRKQKGLLEQLEKENQALKEELGVLNDNESPAAQKMNDLISKLQFYEWACSQEKETFQELDAEASKVNKEIEGLRKAGAQTLRSASGSAKINPNTLENRLEKENKKFSAILASNSKLRETIEHLRSERKVFDTILKKLDKKIQQQKKQMADVVENTNQAFTSRDEYLSKIHSLKEKSDKEVAQFNTEVKEMTRVLEHDRKLKSFMGVKTQDRSKKAGANTTTRKTITDKDAAEETIESYESAFAKIKEVTQMEDIEKIVSKFLEAEDANFSLYNFVNELNTEIESLQEMIQDIKDQIKRYHAQGEAMEAQRMQTTHDLEERLAATQDKLNDVEGRNNETMVSLGQLQTCIESLFGKIGCDRTIVDEMLGNAKISEANMLLYLGLVEQRTNELLHMQAILDTKAALTWEKKEQELLYQSEDLHVDASATLGPKPKITGLLGAGPLPSTHGTTHVMELPSATLDSEGEEEEEMAGRPMSHTELKAKLAKGSTRSTKKK